MFNQTFKGNALGDESSKCIAKSYAKVDKFNLQHFSIKLIIVSILGETKKSLLNLNKVKNESSFELSFNEWLTNNSNVNELGFKFDCKKVLKILLIVTLLEFDLIAN